MLNGIAFGLAVGAGIQAWRAWPAGQTVTADGMFLVFVIGLLCAYLGGRWHGTGRGAFAMATATATATAQANNVNTVQLAVLVPGASGARPEGMGVPSESAPWMVGATERHQLDVDDIDGMDLAELFDREEESSS